MKRSHSAFNKILFTLCVCIALCAISVTASSAQGKIVHFVSVGGPDFADPDFPFPTGPGVDKDFALTAFQYADGTVSGHLIDRWGGGGGVGLKATLGCVHVVGNNAWVSGVIVQGMTLDDNGDPFDLAGWYVRTRVQDNGPNNDPANPDRIGISVIRSDVPWDCTLMRGGLFEMPRGQAIVR